MQTTSPKNGKNGLFWVRWSAIWANPGTRQTRPPTTATFPRNTADKSPPQQREVSILRLIGHVVSLGFVPCMPWYALLVRTWACYSEPGQPRPRTEQTAHVRNSGFTCGTRWNPGRCRTRPIHDGSWGTHTQARDAVFTGTRQTRPTKIVTFPRDKAKKSPLQQHVVSYNPKEPPPQKKDSGHAKAGPDAPTRPTTRRLKHHVCAYSPPARQLGPADSTKPPTHREGGL